MNHMNHTKMANSTLQQYNELQQYNKYNVCRKASIGSVFLYIGALTAMAQHPLLYRIKCMTQCCIIIEVQCSHKLLKHKKPDKPGSQTSFLHVICRVRAVCIKNETRWKSGFIEEEAIKITAVENAFTSHMSLLCVLETSFYMSTNLTAMLSGSYGPECTFHLVFNKNL